jgi:hypothetical protein
MRIFWRRSARTSKEAALAEAREATAQVRREQEKVRRWRSKKQPNPVEKMTTNQWIAGGN